ncbi:MAG: hypothetical protein WD733_03115 [Bryobacterales bacterium]
MATWRLLRRHLAGITCSFVFLVFGTAAFADTMFTDSATLLPGSGAGLFTFDTLSVGDTPEGFMVTGSFTATFNYEDPGGHGGGFDLTYVTRTLGETSVQPRAHLSATVSTTGDLIVDRIAQTTFIFANPNRICSSATSDFPDINAPPNPDGLSGSYDGPTSVGQVCGGDPLSNADLIPGVAVLSQQLLFFFHMPVGGQGSLQVTFQSCSEALVPGSVYGESPCGAAAPEPVPEPSLYSLLAIDLLGSTAVMAVWVRRRRRAPF